MNRIFSLKLFFFFSVSLCLCGSKSSLQAASPTFTYIVPKGAQRGTDVVTLLTGTHLGDTQEVIVYYPGIKANKFEIVNETTVKVFLTIAPDCRLGEHLFRIRTATGISDARTFWIGALPVVQELEPNNDFEKAQPIPMNCTVNGGIAPEDVDYFVVECKKGERLSVEIEGMRLGLSFWDPYIAILNEKRFELVTNDDCPMIGQDSGCSILVPADGKYIIMVREAGFAPGNVYRLHVGHFPRPTAVIPAGGKPGETLDVKFIGDPKGDIVQKVTIPANDPLFRLHCSTDDGIAPTGFKFQMIDLPNVIESGTNTNFSVATPGPTPAAFHGVISKAGETKFFKLSVKKGQVFDIRCYARQLGSPLDTVLNLCDSKGSVFASNDDSGGPDSYLRYTAPDDRELILGIHDHLKKGGMDYFFRIEVAPPVNRTVTNIPKANGNNIADQERLCFAIPQGGRFATLITVARSEFGGPAKFEMPGLPAGVTAAYAELEPGVITIPMVFEAKPGAAVTGSMMVIQAVPIDPNIRVVAQTGLDFNFNIGGNNHPYHKHVTSTIATAVTQPAPFSIDVVEPKAAIPQNGVYQLKIVAKRVEGFKGAINLRPLLAPPGVGIIGTAVIPPEATETTMTVNVAPNAAGRKWKTAIQAFSETGRGVLWTSSQLFQIETSGPIATFAQGRAAVEQGVSTPVAGKLTVNVPFSGDATVKLLGLPTKATAPDLKINAEAKELTFSVTTGKDTPAGKNNVFAQLVAVVNGETIVQNMGGAELRIDVPLPPKVAAPAATTTPPVAAPPKPTDKPLSRLEQLRKEQEEREKAEKKQEPKK